MLKGKLKDLRNDNKLINKGLIKMRESFSKNEFQVKGLRT